MSVCLSVCLSICVFVCLSKSSCPPVCPSLCLSVCLSVSVCPSVCLSHHVCLSVPLSSNLCVSQSVCLSVERETSGSHKVSLPSWESWKDWEVSWLNRDWRRQLQVEIDPVAVGHWTLSQQALDAETSAYRHCTSLCNCTTNNNVSLYFISYSKIMSGVS